MKTIIFLAVLCFILAFSANNAISQKVITEQTVHWNFTQAEIPCLTETVSGDVYELQSWTNKTYHVKPRGVLYGAISGDDYDIKYEWNSFSSPKNSSEWQATLPMTIWHDGKLIAELHWVYLFQYNGKEIRVVDKTLYHVNCK